MGGNAGEAECVGHGLMGMLTGTGSMRAVGQPLGYG